MNEIGGRITICNFGNGFIKLAGKINKIFINEEEWVKINSWQPIYTAPKDGTVFDGYGYVIPDSGITIEKKLERIIECYWGKRDSCYISKIGWCSNGSDGWAWAVELTHWMPLPTPPEKK